VWCRGYRVVNTQSGRSDGGPAGRSDGSPYMRVDTPLARSSLTIGVDVNCRAAFEIHEIRGWSAPW
jgi:hypothetical protein